MQDLIGWESFILGGASIITCLFCWMFTDKSLSVYTISQLAFALAFVVNHPHFASSYQMLYRDFSKKIFTQPRFFWAAIVVPLILISAFVYCFSSGRADHYAHLLTAMYFFVGWHYVKQIFGCVMVTSVHRQIFYKKWEKSLMLANLFSIWSISWAQSHVYVSTFDFYGIKHSSLEIPPEILTGGYGMMALTGLAVIAMHVRKYINEDKIPAAPAVVSLVAIYIWYLPLFAHPVFAFLIPFFHSLQYLGFVWLLKRNQTRVAVQNLQAREQRKKWITGFVGYFAMAVLLGAIFFEFLPKFLDTKILIAHPDFGSAPILASFLIFINIHHYFIDNVLWRSDTEEIRQYLFATSEKNKATEDSAAPSAA